jgi:hypothetical protein
MAKWSKRSLKLRPNHLWQANPGYKIFVADRGAVRFDVPEAWVIVPDAESGSIKFHDKQPPDDDCTLQLSVFRLPPIDWSGLPLRKLITDLTAKESRGVLSRGGVVDVSKGPLEACWTEVRFRDDREGREAYSRTLLARKADVQALITFDYWADDAPRLRPVWDEVLASLRLAQTIGDPTLGDLGRG